MELKTAKRVQIDQRIVELLPGADLSKATEVQAEVYRYLAEMSLPACTSQYLMQRIGLSIPQPLWSRIEHLAEKGLVQLL